jgi:predicted nucleotidyltransferase
MASDYAAAWRSRAIALEMRRDRRAREAIAAAQRCARLLYDEYGVSEVYLFGSLVTPEAFHDRSDIDLAVAGLPPRLYFRALADLWRELPPAMELDLVPLEDADPDLHDRVVAEGVPLRG